ncbi:MAG: aminopeptidase P family protein [Actinobacteria bacterium]|nr:aminopeptidase P family protein [Actinomycetota bacterium]
MTIADRVERVRTRLAGTGTVAPEAMLVSDLSNIRWLTGFTGSNGWVLFSHDRLTLITDGRYGRQAARQLADAGVEGDVLVGATAAATLEHIAACCRHFGNVAFEAAHVTFAQHAQYVGALKSTLVPVTGVVESERRTKDDSEIEKMAEACRVADQALADVVGIAGVAVGQTEAQVRDRLEISMRELGASGPSYETIVATGPINAALPHHRPTATRIEAGQTVIIDVGALVDGYHSDMTRTYFMGEPTPLQRELYEVVLAAQRAGVAAVAAGMSTKELDGVCRDIISAAGYGEWFTHGTGHGVGLLIHEEPFVNRASDAILQVGDVVTVEPGVYHEGFGGIRIEDLVVVTSDGCRVLTNSPKDSPCLPSQPTI